MSRERGRAVRIAGWILLVVGLVLCLSVVWAPLGLLMMGVGLVSLQVAEQKQRKARTAVASANAGADKPMEESAIPRPKEPKIVREPPPIPGGAVAEIARGEARRIWRDIGAAAPRSKRSLTLRNGLGTGDYGQQYVDAFARTICLPSKSRIAGIVDGSSQRRAAFIRPDNGAHGPIGRGRCTRSRKLRGREATQGMRAWLRPRRRRPPNRPRKQKPYRLRKQLACRPRQQPRARRQKQPWPQARSLQLRRFNRRPRKQRPSCPRSSRPNRISHVTALP